MTTTLQRSPGSRVAAVLAVMMLAVACSPLQKQAPPEPLRWNILFVFADDWGRYAGAYADIDARPGIGGLLPLHSFSRVVESPHCLKLRDIGVADAEQSVHDIRVLLVNIVGLAGIVGQIVEKSPLEILDKRLAVG